MDLHPHTPSVTFPITTLVVVVCVIQTRGVLESSHRALSIGTTCKTIPTDLPIAIHVFVHILGCSGGRKARSSDLESSHRALSIGISIEVKYRCFVNRFN